MDAVDVGEGEAVEAVLQSLVARGYSAIYIVESLAGGAIDAIEDLMRSSAMSIVIMRDHRSSLGLGMELDRRAAIDAVGTDAFFRTPER